MKGASKGEGLGNKFLSHIREVDAIVHVVRCFEDENITHVESTVDPVRDIGTINLELILADMETVQRRLDRAKNSAKGGDKKFLVEAEFLQRVYDHLSKEQCARTMELSDEEKEQMRDLFLLTSKPVIYAANIAEKDMGKADAELPFVKRVEEFAARRSSTGRRCWNAAATTPPKKRAKSARRARTTSFRTATWCCSGSMCNSSHFLFQADETKSREKREKPADKAAVSPSFLPF